MISKIIALLLFTAILTGQPIAYILCEGNFSVGNSTLWRIDEQNEISGVGENPLGDTGQSLTIHDDRLYAIMNGTGTIEVFDIQTSGNLAYLQSINLNFSGPREMVVLNGKGYVTEWYTNSIAILDITTLSIIGNIAVSGLPEDIVTDGEFLYASITMNPDWTSSNLIVVIDPETESVITEYQVADGPGPLILINQDLIVSSTYYDASWNSYAATSKINLSTGVIDINDYGQSTLFGTDIIYYQGSVYRIYNNGIIRLDNNLSPIPESHLGGFPGLYSMSNYQNFLYLGLSNFVAPDDAKIIDFSGNEIASFQVGAIPGSFAFHQHTTPCEPTGDTNNDTSLDILDLVQMISHILGSTELPDDEFCLADSNSDGVIDILDVVYWVDQILANP